MNDSQPMIIDRGRGPEIAGTRITVFDILDYDDWHHTRVAAMFQISSRQVLAARQYIDEHKDDVMCEYRKILERCERGNPPELQAKLDWIHEEMQGWLRERRAALQKAKAGAGDSRG